jgi:hypothetical protein
VYFAVPKDLEPEGLYVICSKGKKDKVYLSSTLWGRKWEWRHSSTHSLTSALDASEWSA